MNKRYVIPDQLGQIFKQLVQNLDQLGQSYDQLSKKYCFLYINAIFSNLRSNCVIILVTNDQF